MIQVTKLKLTKFYVVDKIRMNFKLHMRNFFSTHVHKSAVADALNFNYELIKFLHGLQFLKLYTLTLKFL